MSKLERAIKALEQSLKWTPEQMRLLAKYDQVRAECRDNPEIRERVVIELVESGCEREDAEEWIDRQE